ncbi:MAG: Ni/Fe-hydrogenase 1 B-type cytochrome [Geobacteraceae bacterium]|nr:MAG: Ni/Fe-hydrogenase 1 B-type cytochrome [Geobacteraceae bacterium]
MGKVVIKYVWEIPVRVTHWINVLCIITLCFTGLYIGSPKTLALNPSQYIMGWTRFLHFVAGYTFTVSVLARIYWAFVGNEYSRWRVFIPWLTSEGRRRMWEVSRWYVFLSRRLPADVGLNAMAATIYLIVFLLYLFMIVTGFALYVQYDPHSFMHALFGWLLPIIPAQWLRLTHHLAMWLLIGFVINHIYSAWLVDIRVKGGVISGIFSGYKSVEE